MKKHLSIIAVLNLCLLFHLQIFAQSATEDVLRLKNGWILRGKVTMENNDSVSIITHDRNQFRFAGSEVSGVSKEKRSRPELNYREYGFGHYTEIGALAATKNRPDNVTTAAFSFQTVNGYRFKPYLFTGIGVAADLYATQTTIPVFASVRGNILQKGLFIPYYFIDGGYGFDITSSTTSTSYKGGAMFAAGIGFKIRFSSVAGFHVNFGYRMQKGATTESGTTTDYTNNRIAMRAGFYL